MQSYKAYALIIKRTNLGEADRIITAFSREFGKIKFVAKGVRRIKSKVAGAVEPFYFSDLLIAGGKNLDILQAAEIKKTPLEKIKSLETVKSASFIAELIDKMLPENKSDTSLFELVEETFNNLANGANLEALRFYFISKFIQLAGLFPETLVCVKCGQKPDGKIYFSNYGNGILDSSCQNHYGDAKEISLEAVKVWRFASMKPFGELGKIKIAPSLREELTNVTNSYLYHITQREFNSDRV